MEGSFQRLCFILLVFFAADGGDDDPDYDGRSFDDSVFVRVYFL